MYKNIYIYNIVEWQLIRILFCEGRETSMIRYEFQNKTIRNCPLKFIEFIGFSWKKKKISSYQHVISLLLFHLLNVKYRDVDTSSRRHCLQLNKNNWMTLLVHSSECDNQNLKIAFDKIIWLEKIVNTMCATMYKILYEMECT